MTEILERPFDKIAMELVTECETFTSGNKHILTIIDHLTGWPDAFPIPDKSADAVVSTFINHYLPVHMCPRYILLDNGTEFKNQLMDQVLQQLRINHIFSAPYHPQSTRKLEVFNKYLKPTLKKLCEKDPANWDKYINQVLTSYRVKKFCYSRNTFLFDLWKRPKSIPTSTSGTNATFPRRSRIWKTQLRTSHPHTSHCKEDTGNAQKTTDRKLPSFQLGDRPSFKNKQPEKWDLKWRPGYRIVHIEYDGHYLHTENQATGKTRSCNVKDIVHGPPIEFWNIDTQFGRARKFINNPMNLTTIKLSD